MTGPQSHFQTNSESRRTCHLHEVTLLEARRVVAFQIQLMLEQKESSTGWRLRGKGLKLYDKECFNSNCILIDKCWTSHNKPLWEKIMLHFLHYTGGKRRCCVLTQTWSNQKEKNRTYLVLKELKAISRSYKNQSVMCASKDLIPHGLFRSITEWILDFLTWKQSPTADRHGRNMLFANLTFHLCWSPYQSYGCTVER